MTAKIPHGTYKADLGDTINVALRALDLLDKDDLAYLRQYLGNVAQIRFDRLTAAGTENCECFTCINTTEETQR